MPFGSVLIPFCVQTLNPLEFEDCEFSSLRDSGRVWAIRYGDDIARSSEFESSKHGSAAAI